MRTTVVPKVTAETEEFWEFCRRGVLSVQRCADCGRHRFPPQPMCPKCHSRSWTWEPVDGRGTLFTYTVVTGEGYEDLMPGEHGHPFAIAIVEIPLDEPVRMVTDVDTEWLDQLEIGMPMQVVFEPVSDQIHLPRFVPDKSEEDQ